MAKFRPKRVSSARCITVTDASDKKDLREIIADCYRFYSRIGEPASLMQRAEIVARFGDLPDEELLRFWASERTAQMADRIKQLGLHAFDAAAA